MAIPYVKQTHTDGVVNQFNAARANQLEQGVFDAHYQPAVRVFHNAAQSITSATPTNLAFNSERIDQASNAADTMHDTVTNNSRLTCRYAGVYLIIANIEWAASTAGTRILTIRLNATTNIGSTQVQSPTSAIFQQVTPTMYPLAVNDFVTAEVTQNSGGALNVNATGNISPEFMMVRLG